MAPWRNVEPAEDARARVAGAVDVRDVSKAYSTPAGLRIHALRDVSLRIDAGEVVAVTAPSGAGKSTLLHMLGAMDRPDTGTITVDGTEIVGLPRRQLVAYRRTVGFVFQSFHLLAALDARGNVLAPLLPYRTSFDKAARAEELIAAVGLSGREDALPSRLSGGQQQRVAIARALVNEPRLLLADEPTGNLDSGTSEEILDLLLSLNRDRGTTIVMVTHDPAVASRCQRTIELLDGAIVAGA